MFGIKTRLLTAIKSAFPQTIGYFGPDADVWLAGTIERGPSIAAFFCGEDAKPGRRGRSLRTKVMAHAAELGASGTPALLFSGAGGPGFPDPGGRTITAPLRIALRKSLPTTQDALLADIKNSTTQEDLRRIRKAGFTFRTTTDPAKIREFHARFYAPLVAHRFPEDGWVMSPEDLISGLGEGGELLCADLDGNWVGGLYNWAKQDSYSMGPLGILGADEALRHKRIIPALLVGSMERAVTLGLSTAKLGYSVPFLGKGPIWFKAKWGCTLDVQPDSPTMKLFLDLRHSAVQRVLADSPIVFRDGGGLAVASWLIPGPDPLTALLREAERFSSLPRWYVLADPETMNTAKSALHTNDRIVPVGIDPNAAGPRWLGQALRGAAAPVRPAALRPPRLSGSV